MKKLIIIPARMESKRLPGKPLAKIGAMSMIAHVWRAAIAADLGGVIVAAGNREIVAEIQSQGGQAVLAPGNYASGSDRAGAALQIYDPQKEYEIIVNLQGDMPFIAPETIHLAVSALLDEPCDIGTLACKILARKQALAQNIVKAVFTPKGKKQMGRGVYFTRNLAPFGPGAFYRHIGIYAYHRYSLEKFCLLPPSGLEQRESLEQNRALEAGMHIRVALSKAIADGVDNIEDLEKLNKQLISKKYS